MKALTYGWLWQTLQVAGEKMFFLTMRLVCYMMGDVVGAQQALVYQHIPSIKNAVISAGLIVS
jgi:hypothetical protein